MAKNKKPRKRRVKRVEKPIILNEEQAEEVIFLDSIMTSHENTEIYKTPSGAYKINDDAGEIHVKSSILKRKLLELALTKDLEDDMEVIIQFEKLKVRHPREPYLYQTVTSYYKDFDKTKYKEELKKNYALFPEYPRTATTYAATFGKDMTTEDLRKIIGEHTDIHKIFPKFKCFDVYTVVNFLSVHNALARREKDFEKAIEHAESIEVFFPDVGRLMLTQTKMEADPVYKRKKQVEIFFTLAMILGVIIAIIYGIVKFFQWIF